MSVQSSPARSPIRIVDTVPVDTVPPPPPTTVATTVALPDGCSPSSMNEKKHVRRNSALKEWKEKAEKAQQNKVIGHVYF